MSQDIKDWLHTYSTQVKATFGERIQFIGLQAVSYTHLDVYKRQRYHQ